MLAVDSFITFITWLPGVTVYTLAVLLKNSAFNQILVMPIYGFVMYIMMSASCFLTPVIYYSLNRSFRVSDNI